MAGENVNWHTHDAGLFHWDWNYWTDQSVDDAIPELSSHRNEPDGITVDHVMAFINSAADVDQITQREARMQVAVLNESIPYMTLGAKRLADQFIEQVHARVTNIFDSTDERFAENQQDWIGTGIRTGASDPIFEGDEMHQLLSRLDESAHPWIDLRSLGFDWRSLVRG
jgi:hypothetical protein